MYKYLNPNILLLATSSHHQEERDCKNDVSGHDISGIWVAFFQECQQYRCGQESPPCMTKPDYWVNIYVIDSVTGRVLTRTRHNNAKGPVHAVCAENWAVRRHSSPPDPLVSPS